IGEESIVMSAYSGSYPLVGDSVQVHAVSGVGVGEVAVCQGPRFGFRVTPTVARSAADVLIAFEAPELGLFTVALHSATGQRVLTIANGNSRSGEQAIRWRVPEELPADIYFLRLQAHAGTSVSRLVVR
ncbi:MAG: hypothetical protein ABIK62_06380, partial [candidate division WOR-3 bacterium]